MSDESFKPLRSLDNAELNADLAAKLNANASWKHLIANKKMSVGLVDISDPYNIRYASVNGEEMMYAASLPKIAVLLATMDAFEKNEINETAELDADLKNMISHSNNTSASRFINLCGLNKIQKVLTDPKYMLYDQDHGGGLWVGKCYAGSGARNPDPMKGLSHAATAAEVCNFYYMMAMGKLISPERSSEMLSIMDNPALHHKFVSTLDKIAPGAHVYRKSGTWANWHSDSVMVWGEGRKYILVALIEDPAGESIIRSLVQPMESVLKINASAHS
ncbi:MAG: serine hydrolase [Saprospiraceae bacterium]